MSRLILTRIEAGNETSMSVLSAKYQTGNCKSGAKGRAGEMLPEINLFASYENVEKEELSIKVGKTWNGLAVWKFVGSFFLLGI